MISKDSLINGRGYDINRLYFIDDFNYIYMEVFKSFTQIKKSNTNNHDDMIYMHKAYVNEVWRPTVLQRTLSRHVAENIMKQEWLNSIARVLDLYPVDMYGLGYPTCTWRLTRPHYQEDVGCLHKDVWFRTINEEERVVSQSHHIKLQLAKVWLALEVELGRSGLLVIDDSQNYDDDIYDVYDKQGMKKPMYIRSENHNKEHLLDIESGQFVVFGEHLIHGGAINSGSKCRVSIEIPLAPRNYKAKSYHGIDSDLRR